MWRNRTEPGEIGRGVRQGCPLSALLFSIYAESIMRDAIDEIEEGVVVGGRLLKDVRLADDQAMVAGSSDGLQRLMDGLNRAAEEYGMKIKRSKRPKQWLYQKQRVKESKLR